VYDAAVKEQPEFAIGTVPNPINAKEASPGK
jgi:hypothetical protein